ncbi:MAG TPA: hypothetical protein VK929_00380 [Longimicrobiales bacterium]|nr:hypothetical protein [Longimicrobiales bacterium]
MRTRLAVLLVAGLLPLILPTTAEAIPAFARKYGVSCNLCHSTAPRLNAYGEAFAGNGFELVVGEEPRDTIDTGDPLLRLLRELDFAIRMDLFATALTPIQQDGANIDLQMPFGIKLLTGGVLAHRISYYMYFYMSERGEVAGLEDAYIQFTDIASTGVSAIVGQFQVSDPLFKRELRLQYEDYHPYRVRVGAARADLTYDRGVLLTWSPWDGGDVAFSIVNGRGLTAAAEDRHYDRDNDKPISLRYSQELGPIRIGGFGYLAHERNSGFTDRIVMYGPDATLTHGNVEVNAQYLRREDSNPLFAGSPTATTVNSALVEVLYGPFGTDGRWTLAGLYNRVRADQPLLAMRVGGADDTGGFTRRYETVSAGTHYLAGRNVRFMGEVGYDIEGERTRFTTGVVLAF